jgi:hypothetical protein
MSQSKMLRFGDECDDGVSMKSWITRILAIAAIALVASACSPQELKTYYQSVGISASDAQIAIDAQTINDFVSQYQALHRFDYALSDASLLRLRTCESHGNYQAVSASGAFRGAYQFSRSTWNGVASANFPQYVGVDPAAASPDVQDAFTRALYVQLGSKPWPVCGQRI